MIKSWLSKLPRWLFYALHTIAAIVIPVIVFIIVILIISTVAVIGESQGLLYMRTEAMTFAFMPFCAGVMVTLLAYWSEKKRRAFKILGITVAATVIFIGVAGTLETIKTKPIVAAAASFKEPTGMVKEVSKEENKISAATSGFLMCIEDREDGCPHIVRTWNAAPGQELTRDDLQKALDNSGWAEVKIQEEDCDLFEKENGSYPDCVAEGMVGDYETTVGITKTSDQWELRLYVREPHVRK